MRSSLHRPKLAIALMFGAQFAFVAMQAVVKIAREVGMDTSEVMFYRTAPALPFLWWILKRQGHGLMPTQTGNVLVRSLLGSCAMGTNFTSMRALSLAQFSTLGLSQPVFVALFAPLLLRERVMLRAWIAIVLAGSGAYVMIAPGLRDSVLPYWPALLALASALFSAFAHIWVRKATEHDPPERVVFHFAATVSLLGLAFGLSRGFFTHLPEGVSPLSFVLIVLGMSSFGTLGQVLMTRAHVFGEASSVAMVSYTSVALASGVDLVLWNVRPDVSAGIGALLMVCAGVVLLAKRKSPLPASVASPVE